MSVAVDNSEGAEGTGSDAPLAVDWLRFGVPEPALSCRLPRHVPQIRLKSVRRSVSNALRIFDRSGLADDVLRYDRDRRGPARTVSMRTVILLLLAYQVQRPSRDLAFLPLVRWATSEMSGQDRERIGLTHPRWSYYKVVATFHAFIALIDDADSNHRVDGGGLIRERHPALPSRHMILNRIIGAAIPDACPPTPVAALDSTDVEASGAWANSPDLPDRSDGDDEYIPDDVAQRPAKRSRRPKRQWPQGPDGRNIYSSDPDARAGYRTVVHNRSRIFIGWDAHVLCDAGWYGAHHYVQFIRGMLFEPAGQHKGRAGIDLIDSLAPGFTIDTLCSDRGYSYSVAEQWVEPLQARGITWVHDLHTNQRTPRSLMHHDKFSAHIMIDGTLFTRGMPERLHTLPRYHPGMTYSEKRSLAARYDERAQYAFVPNGGPRSDGSWQYRGPAYLGRVNCINMSSTRRLNRNAPLTSCREGDGCWCDKMFRPGFSGGSVVPPRR
ncbi:hypothetical protein DEI93_03310 [Curtobacterium sp. MCBD17_035]|uniref:hypothetical protein n=1 Tax=Curtobacterium sp. MCBD17_035 TaxID=2175673 RepID=UPI0011B6BEB4|nr:hypothetical protein [Curtobacterium sp. MCBD17_035]WIB68086.1 hypothetical protein DEI93_03310 [Curtobacterium sp. MCBD17_035]